MSLFPSFRPTLKRADIPKNPIEADADRIARVAVDTVCGEIKVGPLDGMLLKAAFERYKNNPEIQTKTFEKFADLLCMRDRALAAKLVDFLGERVGR